MAFPNHLLTLATLRLLTLVPANERFHSVKSDPLHVLTELTAAYLQLLAETAKSYAEQAGRISPNAIDARDAIAHFGVDINEIHEWCEDRQLGKGILRGTDGSVGELAPSADGGDAPAPNGIALQQHASNESADLGALLKDTLYSTSTSSPTKLIQYTPLTRREERIVEAVQQNQSLLPFFPADIQRQVYAEQASGQTDKDEDHLSSSPSSSRAISQPPPTYQQATAGDLVLSTRQREKLAMRGGDDHDALYRDDPLSFLPPFPDKNAGQDALQTIIEDESGRTVKRARRALDINVNSSNRKTGSLAWQKAIPYDTSSLAEYEGGKFNMPSIPEAVSVALEESFTGQFNDGTGKDKSFMLDHTDDPLAASSLLYFLETFNWVALEQEQQAEHGQALLPLRHNVKRKRAATAIHSNILNPADDSLSGSIPAAPPRHAKKQAGWIPYPPTNNDIQDPSEPAGKAVLPFPAMHPFTTQLPASLTEPVPTVVLPHPSKVLAPLMHPRYPTAHTSIRTLLESASPALFGRTTRLGPPGPLLDNGSAGYYQVEPEKPNIPGWPGEAMPRMMGWNFDWEIGNELEDAIKQRKASGIADVSAGINAAQSSGKAGDTSRGDSRKGTPGPSGSSTAKDSYEGPNFPALPARPQYNPLQAQMQREEEEQELKFQEVQEGREEERQLQEQIRLQQEREAAETKAAAEAAAEAARAEAEARQAQAQAETQTPVPPLAQSATQDQNADTVSRVAASRSTGDQHQPKRSLSIKLSTSTSAPPNNAAETLVNAPAFDFEEIDDSNQVASGEGAPLLSGTQLASADHASSSQVIVPGVADAQIRTMWSQPGSSLEQDYRAPAANINALVQPPILIPPASAATEGGIKQLAEPTSEHSSKVVEEPLPETLPSEVIDEDAANGQEVEDPTPIEPPAQVYDMQAVGLDGMEVENQLHDQGSQLEHFAGGQVGFDFLPAGQPELATESVDAIPALGSGSEGSGETLQSAPIIPEVPAQLDIQANGNGKSQPQSPAAPVPISTVDAKQPSLAPEEGSKDISMAPPDHNDEVDAEQDSEDDLFDEVLVKDDTRGGSNAMEEDVTTQLRGEPNVTDGERPVATDNMGHNIEIEELDM